MEALDIYKLSEHMSVKIRTPVLQQRADAKEKQRNLISSH